MVQREPSLRRAGSPVENVASDVEREGLTEIASGVLRCSSETVEETFDPTERALAALYVASRRSEGPELSVTDSCELLSIDPAAVTHAVDTIQRSVSLPAPADERRRLRQTILAITELLSAKERGLSNGPRLRGPAFEVADPSIVAACETPLDSIDSDALRTHRHRLSEDLELARLGTDLYVQVRAGAEIDERTER
ncbi:hypothetical protein [Halovivax gelatinilyticus]|uniref:hypothetical protein n=1 Tax=Halovivax gelatinilyticus TaxID=2961597 RepID=UPI0020CA4B26|nr:hypothetical protein [Halovivax gelatinilyticus]